MISTISFIVVIGILVFVHELGHFVVARLCGVGVEKFSLGFGPRIFGKTVGITDYRVSAIPLGGYVKMVGDEPGADIAPEDIGIAFTHKPLIQKSMIVAAGPVANLIFAAIIFFLIHWILGANILQPVIGDLSSGMPAEIAGLKSGDRIVGIDGKPIDTWEEMAKGITESQGRELTLSIERDGNTLTTYLHPRQKTTENIFGEKFDRYMIGIAPKGDFVSQKTGFFEAMAQGVTDTWNMIALTLKSVVKMIQGAVSADNLGGPIMIAEMAGEQARAGIPNFAFYLALISVNLALINLFPIPILDGGHLLFFFIEAIIRRPVSIRVREVAQQIGAVILIMLMIFVFYNDLHRIFTS